MKVDDAGTRKLTLNDQLRLVVVKEIYFPLKRICSFMRTYIKMDEKQFLF